MVEPFNFPEVTNEIAKDQEEYRTLPAHISQEGVVTTCWKLSEDEILKVIETGEFWIQQMTFRQCLQPILPSIEKPELT